MTSNVPPIADPNDHVDKATFEGLAAFRLALRQFLAFSDSATKSAGVTVNQYQAMLALKASQNEAMTIRELADHLLLVRNGAVQLVDRLEGLGLATREDSPTDGRSVIVALTEKGNRLIQQLAGDHLNALIAQRPLLVESLKRLKRIQLKPEKD